MMYVNSVNPFAIGSYALISPASGLVSTKGLGRIGKILFSCTELDSHQVILELALDALTGHSEYAIMPTDFLLPMPTAYVEQFSPRRLKTAYRLSALGTSLARTGEFPSTTESFGVEL